MVTDLTGYQWNFIKMTNYGVSYWTRISPLHGGTATVQSYGLNIIQARYAEMGDTMWNYYINAPSEFIQLVKGYAPGAPVVVTPIEPIIGDIQESSLSSSLPIVLLAVGLIALMFLGGKK